MNVKVAIEYDFGNVGSTDHVEVSPTALNLVLFDFNPSTSMAVSRIKALHAALIAEMEGIVAVEQGRSPKARAANIAITELEGAQMRCVKALFAK